jgi:hypothetical protein
VDAAAKDTIDPVAGQTPTALNPVTDVVDVAATDTVDPTSEDAAETDFAWLVDVEAPDEPDWGEALASEDKEKWLKGARAELRSLEEMEVFQLIPRSSIPPGRKVLRGKFVCRIKRDHLGVPVHHKVRWVAKGFLQVYGRDYTDTTSPTTRLETLCVILHIAACNDWHIEQYDVKTAFLNSVLPEDKIQFLEQPPGFVVPDKPSHVWKLQRSLYGMRQSSHIWNKTLNAAFLSWGFQRADCEWCVYIRCSASATTIVAVHVDDMLAVSSSPAEVEVFCSELESTWQITALGEPKMVVGIAICHDRITKSIWLNQTALIDKIISKFHQTEAKSAPTPMVPGAQLLTPDPQTVLDKREQERLNTLPYRPLIGSLMYVASGSRPDIAFAVSKLSRFVNCYREVHWQAAVCVVRYLKGTRTWELRLGSSDMTPNLLGYNDSDYANDLGPQGQRSVGGYCFTLGSGMVSWSSRRQKTIATSTCAAEYIAVSEAGKELAWIRNLLMELGFDPKGPTKLLCDNSAAVILSSDQLFHKCVKHLDVWYHWIRERVENGDITVNQITSSSNITDILTKALPEPVFVNLRKFLGVLKPIEE